MSYNSMTDLDFSWNVYNTERAVRFFLINWERLLQSLRAEKVNYFYSMFGDFFPFLSYSDYVPEEDTFQLYMRSGLKMNKLRA